ncbi:hypothetical protein NCCNTM_17590 [Mycolicibacterium sp. NCC-Tsukiji]|nr:hypothetical protein NCCNTM_17590 [Mycolicibacterium sp. NCC-Tsukiji]
MNHRTAHQVSRQGVGLPPGVVEHRTAQLADMLEERRACDAAVVGAHHPGTGVGGELLTVAVPRLPTRRVRIHQHQCVFRRHGRVVGADAQREEPVHPHQPGFQFEVLQVTGLHPADGQIEDALGNPGRLRVRRHHPRVDAQLRDTGRALGQVGRAPVDVADPDRFGVRQTDCPPA